MARCSKQSTRKYLHLWYPDQDNSDQQVCTSDTEPVSAELAQVSAHSPKLPKALPDKEVHTIAYMKGAWLSSEAEFDVLQLCLPFGAVVKSSPVLTAANNSASKLPSQTSAAVKQLSLSDWSVPISGSGVTSAQSYSRVQASSFDADPPPDG